MLQYTLLDLIRDDIADFVAIIRLWWTRKTSRRVVNENYSPNFLMTATQVAEVLAEFNRTTTLSIDEFLTANHRLTEATEEVIRMHNQDDNGRLNSRDR